MNFSQIIEEQNSWHRRAKQGCAFAAMLANQERPESKIWFKVCCNDVINADLIKEMQSEIKSAVDNEDCQVLSIIIPAIKDEIDLKFFIYTLNKYYPNINIDCNYQKEKNYTLVKIKIPIDETKFSWLLGFINLETSPLTRKTPYPEIVIATKSKQYLMEKYDRFSLHKPNSDSITRNEDDNSVHLADIHIDNVTNNTTLDNKLWNSTSKLKKAKLEGRDDHRAKGKVSFTVSDKFELL